MLWTGAEARADSRTPIVTKINECSYGSPKPSSNERNHQNK